MGERGGRDAPDCLNMPASFTELSPQDSWPDLRTSGVVTAIPDTERRLHAPDVSVVLHADGQLLARCSCWWRGTPAHEGMSTGVIGHYAAADAEAGHALLRRACELIAAAGAAMAIGPMDGNTWRRYRFIVERGDEPVFLLEPDNPDEWPAHWTNAGFSPLADYTSAINDDLSVEDPRTDERLARLEGAGGVRIRTIDAARIDLELPRIHALSLRAFANNFLYTPLGAREFAAQYHAVLPLVRPEVVLLAERGGDLLGFMFAIPDALRHAAASRSTP
jgi:hypothetical protein